MKLGEAARGEQVAAAAAPGVEVKTLGLTLRPLTDQDRTQLGVREETQGVFVANVAPNSAAAEKGIRPGDVITQVNQRDVDFVEDALAALSRQSDKSRVAARPPRRFPAIRRVELLLGQVSVRPIEGQGPGISSPCRGFFFFSRRLCSRFLRRYERL